jgi:DNA-binding Lrp family transcriptional regulator
LTFAATGLFISGSKRLGSEPEGRPLPNEVIVILNLFVESRELEKVTDSLVKLSEVTDVYEVTGEYDIVCLLRTENILALREVLKNKVLRIPGVKSTVSAIVLYTHKRDRKAVSE